VKSTLRFAGATRALALAATLALLLAAPLSPLLTTGLGPGSAVAAPLSTEFTYQGQLLLNGVSSTGLYDLRLTLWDALTLGTQIGSQVTLSGVAVTNGLFTTTLNFTDPAAFNGSDRWMQIAVATAGSGTFTTLSPRQKVTAAPYALFASKPWVTNVSNIYYTAGSVGIGTTAPSRPLEVSAAQAIARLTTTSNVFGSVMELKSNAATPTYLGAINFLDAANGVPGQIAFLGATSSLSFRTGGADHMFLDAAGNLGVGTSTPTAKLDIAGTTRTQILTITGGSDLAEPFHALRDPQSGAAQPGPGMVMVIDPENAGGLKLAYEPFDRRVAGVISGANGLSPGMVMSAQGDPHTDGDYPLALTGRVWCWCDAGAGSIQPGDLLTTSATPGHAMKVTDFHRAQGAMIGKAMTDLNEGKGLVLVLVSLQ
jgi:hypothetical protein